MNALYDDQAERAVLSACIQSPLARERARGRLGREDFYSIVGEKIWVAFEELDAAGSAVDAISVASFFQGDRVVLEALPEIITLDAHPNHVETYAETVRSWATRRRLVNIADQARLAALDPERDPFTLAANAVNRFTELRDTGSTDDVQTRLMADLLAEPDDKVDWAVKNLLEKRDRLVLTGQEGLGKSFLARQVGIFSAAGLNPFTLERMEPVRIQILDYENSWSQIRRGSRRLYDFAAEVGEDPRGRIHVASLPRIDITSDRDLSRIHREVDVANPDVIIVGPLYRLTGRAIQTDDEAAPVLAALDTLRDRGCALVIEAHAGHSRDAGGDRDLRPRGSSALLGWPEFGYGLREVRVKGRRSVRMVPWRGDRSERAWPMFLRRSAERSTHYEPDYEAETA